MGLKSVEDVVAVVVSKGGYDLIYIKSGGGGIDFSKAKQSTAK
jgi:hypothetical protein